MASALQQKKVRSHRKPEMSETTSSVFYLHCKTTEVTKHLIHHFDLITSSVCFRAVNEEVVIIWSA